MSFLTPLYIAGMLAVTLPVLFHLIRRTPRGQVPFSSLMFLSASPPRVTRRSRLDNLILLLLRGLALALLALAFARPLFRDPSTLATLDHPSRRIALLVDTSASLRRGDLWQRAIAKADRVLDGVTPADQLALVAFSDHVETLISFDAWNKVEPSQRVEYARNLLKELKPGWGATNLGDALVAAADRLGDVSDSSAVSADAERQIILISDLQQGSRLEALQSHAWPKAVTVDVQTVTSPVETNAGLHLTAATDEAAAQPSDAALRIRIDNTPDSKREAFELHWASAEGPIAGSKSIGVTVPAGSSRVVSVPRSKSAAADRLVLTGDDDDFDNTVFVVAPRQAEVTIAYFAADAADDTAGLRYYLERALVDTPGRKFEVAVVPSAKPIAPGLIERTNLAVVADQLPEDQIGLLREYVRNGGTLLLALTDGNAATLKRLLDAPDMVVEEASGSDFALIGELTFTHPLFAPFADPRFSDFTKIHFWKHRRIRLPAGSDVQVLAKFDDGDPAVMERRIGKGSIVALTSSWRPVDSQLALSSKFVPLVSALLDLHGDKTNEQIQFTVGDRVSFDKEQTPGNHVPSPTAQPGIFDVAGRQIAVNLAADESRTAPLAVEELEQRGAKLGNETTHQADVERRRQLRTTELENRQKLWRWLIVAVLGLVIAETTLAGSLSRKEIPR
jgi:hypothetical protein